MVQAVVSRSFAGKATVEEAQTAVMDRLHSLGQAHILLVDRQWQGTDLRELVSGEMRPFSERVTVSGPPLIMNPRPRRASRSPCTSLPPTPPSTAPCPRRPGGS